ncbi:MAG: hypothetical protein ACM34B_17830 [Nitrospira sp.]
MLLSNAMEDIDRAKRQQWTQFYAILLAQAAVGGFSRLPPIPTDSTRVDGIWWGLIGLLLLGVMVIAMHQLQLWRLRDLVEKYSKDLEQHTQTLRAMKQARSLHRVITPILMGLVLLGVFFFIAMVVLPA